MDLQMFPQITSPTNSMQSDRGPKDLNKLFYGDAGDTNRNAEGAVIDKDKANEPLSMLGSYVIKPTSILKAKKLNDEE